jgi:hypothetical protein
MDRRVSLSRRQLATLGGGALLAALSWSRRGLGAVTELSVVVHPSNANRLSGDDIADVFRSVLRSWPGGKPIAAFELPPNGPERVYFDRTVLRMEPDEVAHYWIDRRMRGGAPPPHQVPEPQIMVRVVGKLENAIGYVPSEIVDSGVRVVARVRAGGVVVTDA